MEFWGTIGPACADKGLLKEMVREGMTGLRMNLSHGMLKDHMDWVTMIHDAGVPEFLIDLQGPELRVRDLAEPVALEAGAHFGLVSDCGRVEVLADELPAGWLAADGFPAGRLREGGPAAGGFQADKLPAGDSPIIPCPVALFRELAPGQELLFDDGKLLAHVLSSDLHAGMAECVVDRGGILQSRKSIAAPGLTVQSPTLTAEDLENLKMAAGCRVTCVMLPFVRGIDDIRNLRRALAECGAPHIRIYAKIENTAGIHALPGFIKEVDHVVIARGDLGNDVPLWELPGWQKRIASWCREARTPFMVVTQMLDSMRTCAVPTRAEVCDVYNAVLDGAASVMLTGETAAGAYPLEAMRYLIETAKCAEKDKENDGRKSQQGTCGQKNAGEQKIRPL